MKIARCAEQPLFWVLLTLLLFVAGGCEAPEESGGAVPVFNFPDEDDEDESEEEPTVTPEEEGGSAEEEPPEPVEPALEAVRGRCPTRSKSYRIPKWKSSRRWSGIWTSLRLC